MGEFLSADFVKFFVPLAGAVFAWLVNEHRRRQLEEYERKEARYRELLVSLRGFYAVSEDPGLKQVFLDQLALCWLYCPDDVIQHGYRFIEMVKTGSTASDQQKEAALGVFVAAIRRDLLSRRIIRRTSLQAADFRLLTVPKRGA